MSTLRRRRARAWATGALSLGLHAGLVAVVLSVRPPPPPAEPPVISVSLVAPEPPPPPPKPPAPLPPAPEPAPAKAAAPPKPAPKAPRPSRRALARKAPPTRDVAPVPTGEDASDDGDAPPAPSAAQLAGATTAESGSGGGACNMLRRLQQALRRDSRVQAAAADAARGPPIYVWNGDWVRHPGQDGAGLAAVREAMLWEIGFAPAECRAETVHGLVLISLADRPGAPKLVLGDGVWRWSDLLGRGRRRG